MPIPLKDYNSLEAKKLKSNKELLDWMDSEKAYSTTEVEKFLGVQHPATLQRLKRLARLGYVELKVLNKTHIWHKLKDWDQIDETIIEHNIFDPKITKSIQKDLENHERKRQS